MGASSVSQPATGFWAETAARSFCGANAAMEVLTSWLIIATAAVAAAANELAAGSKAGRIDNKATHGVSPNQEASLGRRPKFSCSWSGTTGSPG